MAAVVARRRLGGAHDQWPTDPRIDHHHLGPRIWVVTAAGIGSWYVTLQYLNRLRKRLPRLQFVMFVKPNDLCAFVNKAAGQNDVAIPVPKFCTRAVRRRLRAIMPHCLLYFGGIGTGQSLVRVARQWRLPVAWLNAEFCENLTHLRRSPGWRWQLARSFDVICADTVISRCNLLELGVSAKLVHVLGVAKYDAAGALPGQAERALQMLKILEADDAQLLLGATLGPSEEAMLCQIYRVLKPRFSKLLLIVAPRLPHRAIPVLQKFAAEGLKVTLASELLDVRRLPAPRPDVLALDTFGDLRGFYPLASVVFVGRSLVRKGGSNPIEAAAAGRAIVAGPYMQDFAEILGDFIASQAIVQIENEAGLLNAVTRLLEDPVLRSSYGNRAKSVVESRQGAVDQTLDFLEERCDWYQSLQQL